MRTPRNRYWDDIIARRRSRYHKSSAASGATLFTARVASLLALLLLLGLPLSCEEEGGQKEQAPTYYSLEASS